MAMSDDAVPLPNDPAVLKAMIAALQAENQKMSASLRAHDLLVQALRVRIAKLQKQKFGPSSEKIEREIEQLELALEDLQVALAEAEREREEAAAVVAEIEAAQARAEAELTRGGVLSGLNRELLWTNRSRSRVDRELGEELLAESARVLDAARAEMYQRKQQVRSRERVYDYVHAEAIAELRKKEQRELDDLAGQRWRA